MKHHCILGGGVIGLFTAYYLNKAGHNNIVIVDSGNGTEGCSIGNAGMIVPSHFMPLAAPGIITQGFKWMLDNKSPFYLKPRADLDLLKWLFAFYRASNDKRMNQSIPLLRDMGIYSRSLYETLNNELELSLQKTGLMLYCNTEHALEEEINTAIKGNELGIKTNVLTPQEVQKLEPEIDLDIKGAVFYPNDALVDPQKLLSNLVNYLKKAGVVFHYNNSIKDILKSNNEIQKVVLRNDVSIECESLTVATGSWSQQMAQKLGLYLPLQAGKGYSFVSKSHPTLHHPSILVESRIAISPFTPSRIRFGGTMEISGINSKININRVNGIAEAVPKYFKNFIKPVPSEVWYGLRPCSPDGLPYIGKLPSCKNAFINSGHAMMGVSLAPASGQILANMIDKVALPFQTQGLKVDRFE